MGIQPFSVVQKQTAPDDRPALGPASRRASASDHPPDSGCAVAHGALAWAIGGPSAAAVLLVEGGDERALVVGLDRLLAVHGADPVDRVARRRSGHHREAGQGGAGAPVASDATDLDVLAAA